MLKKLCTSLWLLCFVSAACAQEDDQKSEETDDSKRPSWSAGLPERQKPTDLNKPTFKPERDDEVELDMSEFGLQAKPEIEIELPINSGITGVPVGNAEEQAQQAEADEAARKQAEAEAEEAAREQAAAEQAARELAEAEQAARELAEAEQAAKEQAEAEQAARELAEAEQAARELAEAEQAAREQAAAEQAAKELAEAEQAAAEQAENDESVESPTPAEEIMASDEQTVDGEPASINEAASDEAEYSWNIVKQTAVDYPIKAAIDNLEGWVEVEITINPAGEVVSASPTNYSRSGRVFGKPAVQSVSDWLFEPPSNIGITTNLTRIYKIEFEL